jgi:hypothetical protein
VLAIRDLLVMFAKACEDFNAKLIECNGGDDHVHLLVGYPPQVSISPGSSIASRVCPSDGCVLRAQKSEGVTSRALCGRPHTSPPHALVRRSPSSINTWSNYESTRLLPGLNAGVSGAEYTDELS